MELHQLRYFVAVAETENFTKAAQRTNVSQPSLSQQIINLESEIGHKLFHRLGKKAVLTEAGLVFLTRARSILFEVENASKELGDKSGLGRRITVGAIQTVMPFLLTDLIAGCRETHPNLLIDAYEDFRDDLVGAIIDGGLDVAVVPSPVDDHRISAESLLTEPLLIVVGKNHPIASRKQISINDLANETFVSLGDSSTLAAKVRSFFGDHKFQPRIGFRCAQIATLKLWVASGLGISLLPQMAKLPDDRESLVYLRLTESVPTRELLVIRHLQRYQSRGVEQFLGLLREHVSRRFPSAGAVGE
jgi:LysR family hydrogen peroxide-inducible transcriptional activator